MTRTELREKVIFATYDVLLKSKGDKEVDPKLVLSGLFECKFDDVPLFAREVFIKTLINKDDCIALIQPNLNKWTFDRLNYVIQAMLLVIVTEGVYIKETDKKILINEGVNFAKKYADNLDYKFVNAVLDKVLI